MLSSVIKYSLKIWLTSVAITPLLFLLIVFYQEFSTYSDVADAIEFGITMYFASTLVLLICSTIPWALFTLLLLFIVKLPYNAMIKTIIIFITGIFLTAGLFALMELPISLFDSLSGISFVCLIAGSNCLCVNIGVWFYKLKLPQPDSAVKTCEII